MPHFEEPRTHLFTAVALAILREHGDRLIELSCICSVQPPRLCGSEFVLEKSPQENTEIAQKMNLKLASSRPSISGSCSSHKVCLRTGGQ